MRGPLDRLPAAERGEEACAMFKRYNPDSMAAPFGAYAHGIEAPPGAGLFFVSGQIPVRPDGTVPDGMAAQAAAVWSNIGAVLEAAGLTPSHIVRTTQYLVDPESYPEANAARAEFLAGHTTASVSIAVPALVRPEWLIEIDAIAIRPPD